MIVFVCLVVKVPIATDKLVCTKGSKKKIMKEETLLDGSVTKQSEQEKTALGALCFRFSASRSWRIW